MIERPTPPATLRGPSISSETRLHPTTSISPQTMSVPQSADSGTARLLPSDDRHRQRATASRMIALATSRSPERGQRRHRFGTLAITGAPGANPQNVGSRSRMLKLSQALLVARSGRRRESSIVRPSHLL